MNERFSREAMPCGGSDLITPVDLPFSEVIAGVMFFILCALFTAMYYQGMPGLFPALFSETIRSSGRASGVIYF